MERRCHDMIVQQPHVSGIAHGGTRQERTQYLSKRVIMAHYSIHDICGKDYIIHLNISTKEHLKSL